MPNIAPFEKHHIRYDDWFFKNPLIFASELQAIHTLLPLTGVGVEIGVGTGRFADSLGINIGVEPSSKMAEMARERGINVIQGVAEELPLDDAQFDYVLLVTTICFLDDIERTFSEVCRVLRQGGFIIIGFIDSNCHLAKSIQLRKDKTVFFRDAAFYSVDEVIALLKEAGFKDFTFVQTLFQENSQKKIIEPTRDGYGEGSFVVIRAKRS